MNIVRCPFRNAVNTAAAAVPGEGEGSSESTGTSTGNGRNGQPHHERDALEFFQNRTVRRYRFSRHEEAKRLNDVIAGSPEGAQMTGEPEGIEDSDEKPVVTTRERNGRRLSELDDDLDLDASCSQHEPLSPITQQSDGTVHKWTDSMREALVLSIGRRDIIWNKSRPLVSNSWLKAKLWREVAKEMNEQFGILFPVDDMKRVWTNLRRTYRRTRKMLKKHPLRARRWRFFDAMSFLQNHIADGTPVSDCESEKSSSSESRETFSPGAVFSYDQWEQPVPEQPVDTGLAKDEEPETLQTFEYRMQPRKIVGRDLVQVSIPEIDRLIDTKQVVAHAASRKPLYRINLEEVEDNLSLELKKVFDKMDTAREKVKECLDTESKTSTKKKQELISNASSSGQEEIDNRRFDTISVLPQDVDNLKKVYGDVLTVAEIVLLKALNDDVFSEIKVPTCETVSFASVKLRKVYDTSALSFFIKESMQSGQLQNLLDAFDNFVYHHKPRDPLMSKVTELCDAPTHKSFSLFFEVIEKYHTKLILRCPEQRPPRDESEERRIDEFFEEQKKKKPRFDIEYLAQEEHRRLINARTAVSEKIKKCEAEVQSTLSLLEMIDSTNSEERTSVYATLKAAEEAYEKALKEQQQLEKEYEEFQSLNNVPLRRKNKTRKNPPAKTTEESSDRAQAALKSESS
uniref:MADF domain-containing protein n=1 Tax=Haemonchus contortus TaxID=6289 RepID=A0A7I4XSN2_HAECO